MEYIKKFEGFNLFKKKKPKDEVTANGIFKRIPDEIYVRYNCDMDLPVTTTYTIDLSQFEIEVREEWDPSGSDFSLYADGVKLDCSEKIIKQIYNKLSEIHKRPDVQNTNRKREDDDYIRKDAKSRFR